MVLSVIE